MESNAPKKKRKRMSRKKFEEKIIAEKRFNDPLINLEDDSYRNNPDYYEEKGISSPYIKTGNDQLNKET